MRSFPETRDGIAIVGMAGRFPGARDVASFWRNLCDGVESVTPLAADSLEDAFAPAVRAAPDFVRARGLLENVDRFDHGFFGMHPREAALTDPQHRILLELSWAALEDAGIDPFATDATIGVYAGCSISTYFLRHVMRDRAAVEAFASEYQVGGFPELVGSGSDFLATRIAYKLDLRGPAMTVQTACSTSLVAVANACEALWAGHADVMLAGAAAISFPQARGYRYQDGGMVSADGHTRTFDAAATGTVFGAGAASLVLKRLADARAAGDRVYAAIRGVGITNDGSAKVGYTAPGVAGQTRAIETAHAMAGFAPASIDYVECHGTATPLGDPIEVEALGRAFAGVAATGKRVAIGSVKPNVGHLDIAAGMAGLMKTALALHDGRLPATLHYTTPNPNIDFAATPFDVNAALVAWPGDGPTRRAGVSAFGVGGTNVHIVLESEPATASLESSHASQPHLLVLSARTPESLATSRNQLAAYLRQEGSASLADVAVTLAGRRAFAHRFAVVAASLDVAADRLEAPAGAQADAPRATTGASVAWLFPGQGSQTIDMGRELYAEEAIFRASVDRCAEIARPMLGRDLRALLYPAADDAGARAALVATENAQPAIFTVSYALAQLYSSWGLAPDAMAGHSVGELVAATLAGTFSLDDALRFVVERGRLMAAMPPGAMLAVRASEERVRALLPVGVDVAAVNSPAQTVVAGGLAEIDAFERRLLADGLLAKRIATSHAFHSASMEGACAPLERFIESLALAPPTMPFVSTVTGTWIDASQATSPAYWASHVRHTVRFGDAVATLAAAGTTAYLELGAGSALASNVRQSLGRSEPRIVATALAGESDERASAYAALGQLWVAGATPDFAALGGAHSARRCWLPGYAFEPTRHWIDAPSDERTRFPVIDAPTTLSVPDAPLDREAEVARELAAMLEELSGEIVSASDYGVTFLELGFDSLFLGRYVQQIGSRFGVAITFRHLLGDLSTIAALAAHVAREHVAAPASAAKASVVATGPATGATAGGAIRAVSDGTAAAIVREQLAAMQQLMREQLAAFGGAPAVAEAVPSVDTVPAALDTNSSRFEIARVAPAGSTDLTPEQRTHVDALVARVNAKTPASKASTQRYRAVLADPRVAAGFRSEWKEMVYPIVCDRARGSRLWDIDDNEYIDILNGFGQTAFGHAPAFVVEAMRARLDRGFAIGPQADLAGEVAERFCALTGNERMTFCNTGSEAVMAAIRVARTVTGRDRIVVFGGSYHGQFDEVLVKGARSSARSIPIAPGIPNTSVGNVTVLKYGAPEALDWLREHAETLAAVVVEPVQSRHPALAPEAFLREVRAITEETGSALILDEVVTGFRVHPGGVAALFGIRPDLATYGKVLGGGMPIGILAGRARFMDALDGGTWSYGDDSLPEVPPTFFAGTFVRHPLVLEAVLAVLRHLEAVGPVLQRDLTERTARLVARLNADLETRRLRSRVETFGSMFYMNFSAEERLAGLLYYHLRDRGIYIQEGFPCFLTTEHGEGDVDAIVAAFAASLDELQRAGIFVPSVEIVEPTEEQLEVWLAAQLSDEHACAFNESVTVRLEGPLDVDALATAFATVVERHESLRATFTPTGEALRVAATGTVLLGRADLAVGHATTAHAALDDAILRDARTPFDVVAGPLARATLFRLAADDYALVFTAHHIVCDGWSLGIVLDELALAYTAIVRGAPVALPPPVRFTDYARRERTERSAADRARVENYWIDRFRTPVAALDVPTDRPRGQRRTLRGTTRRHLIARERYDAIKRAGTRNGCTLFVTLFGAFAALAGRLAASDDVVVAVPAAGQALLDDGRLVGHCVNLLPIRVEVPNDAPFATYLQGVKARVLDAYDHQQYTLGTLVRTLDPQRVGNRLPITDLQFNLERASDGLTFDGLVATAESNAKAFVTFDVFFNVVESANGLRIECDYNTDLYDAATIESWFASYDAILDGFARGVDAPLCELVPDASAPAIAIGPTIDVDREATVADLFERRVLDDPERLAVRCGDETSTYAELDARAERLARYLVERIDTEGARIAICLERSIDLLVALLATHKAGYAYVPLDPSHPAERLATIARAANVAAFVVDDAGAGAIDTTRFAADGATIVHVRRDAGAIAATAFERSPSARCAGASAYVIFTSGSTGVPKGVDVTQRAVVNFLTSMACRPGFTRTDVLLALTTVAFDIAALELFLPLVCGGTVVIAREDDLADGATLCALADRTGSTVMQATPSLWRVLVDAGFRGRPGFRMLCGGEALRPDLARCLSEGDGELWNMYGPTETTIWSSCARIERETSITVGYPIANTRFVVLDERANPVAIGQTGELYIGGDGVARGYVGQPDLTRERFVTSDSAVGPMFRTGDSARILADGTTEIFGRLDHQVKLRGYRIELGEIEAALAELETIAASVVVLREDLPGTPRLVAYYVDRSGVQVSTAELADALAKRLPEYMIPTAWSRLAALPLTPNGKVDRSALPTPRVEPPSDAATDEPKTQTERTLLEICTEVLGRGRFGTNDDLFALGADSIHVFKIAARANRHGVNLAAKQLFTHRTIAAAGREVDRLARPNEGAAAARAVAKVLHPVEATSERIAGSAAIR